ncbi:MAG: glucokinase [Rhizomicrobium sp.]
MSADTAVLVGDIGGTHARFAVVETGVTPWRIDHRLDLEGDFPDLSAALRTYLERTGLASTPTAAAIAVAGPVTAGHVTLTNRAWHTSEDELRAFGFRDALLVNDFAALAFAVAALPPSAFHGIGPDLPGLEGEPITVLGAGTGFGVSCLARSRGRAVALATEAGHAGFAPGDEREIAVLRILAQRFGHVSTERILSGPGIENLHAALAQIAGRPAPVLDAAEIVARRTSDEDCRAAVDMFCAVYGTVAGDLALAHGARGGVFLAGGIAQKIETVLAESAFRARFEAKGRLSPYVQAIPTRLILSEDAAYLGAAAASLEFRPDAP